MTVLGVDTYLSLLRHAPSHAARCRDDLHHRARRGNTVAADVLAELVRLDGDWWAQPLRVTAATDALAAARCRAPLFEHTTDPDPGVGPRTATPLQLSPPSAHARAAPVGNRFLTTTEACDG